MECTLSIFHMGGLQLDTREHALKVITPGDPDKSRIMEAVRQSGKTKMPPSGKLSDDEIGALATWIKDGVVPPIATSKLVLTNRRRNN